jgi:molybdenum cofactor cytidylyltransferase
VSAAAIVPAAGRASRFGGGKLTADIGGEPLLNHTLRSLLDGGVDRLIVVTAPDASLDEVALLNDPRVMRLVNPDPSRGMFSSIQTGLDAAEGNPILVLPGDMPFVKSATVRAVIAAARESGRCTAPAFQGRHGHPLALPSSLREAILRRPATSTLSDAIALFGRDWLDVEDPGVVRDVDVRADLGASG